MMWRQAQAVGDTVVQALSPEALEVLQGLNDIGVPPAVPWTPQTLGWYVLLAVVLALGVWIALARHRNRMANRYRRDALEELAAIESALGAPAARAAALARIPPLLKRVALSVVSRAEAASLTGDAWLAFLDRAYGGNGFSSGPGRLLSDLAYVPLERLGNVSEQQSTELVELVGVWIRSHDLNVHTSAVFGAE